MPTVTVRRFESDEWRLYRSLRLAGLMETPDAFGSMYAWEAEKDDDHWQARLAGASAKNDLPIVVEVDGRPGGLAWGRIADPDASVAHLYQMWVASDARGVGAGRALVDRFLAWARAYPVQAARLDVTIGEAGEPTAAQRLYARAGFVPTGEIEPLRPGSPRMVQPMIVVFDATA